MTIHSNTKHYRQRVLHLSNFQEEAGLLNKWQFANSLFSRGKLYQKKPKHCEQSPMAHENHYLLNISKLRHIDLLDTQVTQKQKYKHPRLLEQWQWYQ